MLRSLSLKPDFDRTIARFEAWWLGEVIDRPPVTLHVAPTRPYTGPTKHHATPRDRWLDVEFRVDQAIAELERRVYLGDSFPIFWPNVGPEITAAPFGCELEWGENTHWSRPIIHRAEDWARIPAIQPDYANRCWQAMEQMTDYALQRCEGRYIVGLTDLHGNYDILAALRDPQELCMDLMDCPELVEAAGRHVARVFAEIFERCYAKVAAAGHGSTTWTPCYHEGPSYVPSCDFWCMVSPRVALDLILPDIITEMKPLSRSIFHLDGPQALQHLDLLLELPQLNAIQWVYGAGHGPASRWIDVYKRCLRAGKSIQVLATSPADALAVLEAVGPRGVWLDVGHTFGSADSGREFLREIGARHA